MERLLITRKRVRNGILLLMAMVAMAACSKKEEPDCVPAPEASAAEGETPEVIKIPVNLKKKRRDLDKDFCQAFVMSKARFMSVQKVWAQKDEARDRLVKRALDKACKDAGYDGECPREAILHVHCKGDELPEKFKGKTNYRIKTIPAEQVESAKEMAGTPKDADADAPAADSSDK